jgi:hypothetical protein
MMNLTKFDNPIIPKPGIYYDIPDGEYRRWNAFSKSLVSAALKTGQHLKAEISKDKNTSAMAFGSLLDCMMLEPHEFGSRYVMQPSTYDKIEKGVAVSKPWNMRSNTCRAIAEEMRSSGKEIITHYDYEKAISCRDSLLKNEEIRRTVERSKKQVSIVWNEPNTGVICKGRLDLYGKTIDDLKTTNDASDEAFSVTSGKFLYHVQAAAYRQGIKMLTGEDLKFRLFVVETGDETDFPLSRIFTFDGQYLDQENGERLWVPDNESLLAGELMFKRACIKIVQYEKHGFTGYSKFPEPFSVPGWSIRRELDRHEEIEI